MSDDDECGAPVCSIASAREALASTRCRITTPQPVMPAAINDDCCWYGARRPRALSGSRTHGKPARGFVRRPLPYQILDDVAIGPSGRAPPHPLSPNENAAGTEQDSLRSASSSVPELEPKYTCVELISDRDYLTPAVILMVERLRRSARSLLCSCCCASLLRRNAAPRASARAQSVNTRHPIPLFRCNKLLFSLPQGGGTRRESPSSNCFFYVRGSLIKLRRKFLPRTVTASPACRTLMKMDRRSLVAVAVVLMKSSTSCVKNSEH